MKLLGVDPGKTTGFCWVDLDDSSRRVVLKEAHAVPSHMLLSFLNVALSSGAQALILEGWETQGRAIDVNCRYAIETIGAVKMSALTHKVPVVEVFSSHWKPAFSRGFEIVKVPPEVKARKAERAIAHAAYHRIKHWPERLSEIKEPERGHVLNALGLALYGEHVWHGECILEVIMSKSVKAS